MTLVPTPFLHGINTACHYSLLIPSVPTCFSAACHNTLLVRSVTLFHLHKLFLHVIVKSVIRISTVSDNTLLVQPVTKRNKYSLSLHVNSTAGHFSLSIRSVNIPIYTNCHYTLLARYVISQLITFASASSTLSNFTCRNKTLTAKLLR